MSGRRHGLRWISVAVSVVFVLMAGAGLYVVVWAYTAKPRPTMVMLPAMRALVAAGPETSVEAWRVLERVTKRVSKFVDSEEMEAREGLKFYDVDELLYGDPRRAESEALHGDLRMLESEGLLAALRSLAEMPPPVPPIDPAEFEIEPGATPLSSIIHGTDFWASSIVLEMCLVQMRLSAIDGDPDEALVWMKAALSLSEAAAGVPTLMGAMVGSFCLRQVALEISMLAREGLLPDEHIRRAMSIINERPRLIALPRIVEGEYIYTIEMLDHCFGTGPVGGGWFVRSEGPGRNADPLISFDERLANMMSEQKHGHWTENLRSPWLPSRRRTLEDIKLLYEFDRGRATMTPWGRRQDSERRSHAARNSVFLFDASSELIDTDVGHESADLATTLMDGTRLALAVELFRRAHGEPPRTLDELVPEFIEVLPKDGFTSDGSFVYRRLDPGEYPEGRLFRLYSVGMNFTDDGGVMDLDQDPPLDDVLFDTVRPAAKPRE